MQENKEIFIEIDESGTYSTVPSKSIENDYYFLICSFISEKKLIKENNKPFHYRTLIQFPKISIEKKKTSLINMATKINKMNVFYSCLKINKNNFTDEDYESKTDLIISKHFKELLYKLTNNNNLTVNINYDNGQGGLTKILNRIVIEFQEETGRKINLCSKKNSHNLDHGYADFLVSWEKVKLKKANNKLGVNEKVIFSDISLFTTIDNIVKTKNIENLKFENFEDLLVPEEDDPDDPPIN